MTYDLVGGGCDQEEYGNITDMQATEVCTHCNFFNASARMHKIICYNIDVRQLNLGLCPFSVCTTFTSHQLNSHLPGEPGFAGFPVNVPSPFPPRMCIRTDQIFSYPPWYRPTLCPSWTPLGLVPPTYIVEQRLIQSVSSLRSLCPNDFNLNRQTDLFNPNSSLNSAFFFLSLKLLFCFGCLLSFVCTFSLFLLFTALHTIDYVTHLLLARSLQYIEVES